MVLPRFSPWVIGTSTRWAIGAIHTVASLAPVLSGPAPMSTTSLPSAAERRTGTCEPAKAFKFWPMARSILASSLPFTWTTPLITACGV